MINNNILKSVKIINNIIKNNNKEEYENNILFEFNDILKIYIANKFLLIYFEIYNKEIKEFINNNNNILKESYILDYNCIFELLTQKKNIYKLNISNNKLFIEDVKLNKNNICFPFENKKDLYLTKNNNLYLNDVELDGQAMYIFSKIYTLFTFEKVYYYYNNISTIDIAKSRYITIYDCIDETNNINMKFVFGLNKQNIGKHNE